MDKSRRDFIKKVAYTAPVLVSLQALPAHAKNGSGMNCNEGFGNGADCTNHGQIISEQVGSQKSNRNKDD